ncbi:MAG TPA: type II secretion system protein GspN [Oligoflexia bacterium]|nr:type II secretion system protein GspN [Oligoflexia bacterium]HMR25549.1 type II secretion system protein GspN [Oligoflexia bacterium]
MKNFLNQLLTFFPNKELLKQNRKYILVGIIVFCLGFVWHFPAQGILSNIIKTIEKQTGVSIQTDDLRLAFPVGLKADNVHITNIPIPALAQTGVKLEKFSIKVSPLSLITYPLKKSGSISVTGQQQKMSFKSNIKISKDVVKAKGSAKGLNMDHDLFIPSAGAKMTIQGQLSTEFNFLSNILALQKNDFSSLEGTLKTTLKQATITPPLMSAIKFDQIKLDSATEKSKAVIKSLKMDGPMLSGSLNGYVDLRPVIDRSITDIDGKIQIGKEGQSLQSMLQLANIRFDASGKGAFKITGPLNAVLIKSY